MKVYFRFNADRLFDKELDSEMEIHMNANHMKNYKTRAAELLRKVRQYDRAGMMPYGEYEEIELTESGPYLAKGRDKLKIDLMKIKKNRFHR